MPRLATLALSLVLAGSTSACLVDRERTVRRYGEQYGWSEQDQLRILRYEVWVGATPEQVRFSLGAPDAVNKIAYGESEREIWSYATGLRWIEFENGVVATIRN